MNVSEQEFKFMVEGITSDLIQLLIDREQYTLPHAVDTSLIEKELHNKQNE